MLSSVYNESIAIATRKGAPVASYSIDRRCIENYVRDLTSKDTCALICFCCARRFPYMPQKRHMKIRKVKLLENHVQEEVNALHVCGLTCTQTETFLDYHHMCKNMVK